MTFPYLTTSPKTDILMTFFLTPLWWMLGFGVFIYQAVAILVFFKLWAQLIRYERPFKVPTPAIWLGVFLLVYAASIFVNFSNHPIQRIMASVNNYFIYLMGFFLVLVVYECDPEDFLTSLCGVGRWVCLFTGLITVFFLIIWYWGDRGSAWPSMLARMMPSLADYPFFYNILTLRITGPDWLTEKIPRLSIYSGIITATGGFMLMVLPLARASAVLRKRNHITELIIYAGGFAALIFSLSRTAICAYFGSLVLVWMMEKKQRIWIGIILVGLSILGAGMIYDGVQWLFESRSSSTVGRLNLYIDAIKIAARENFLLGIGVRLREEFTTMSVGSHSTHVAFFLMTGIFGLVSFVMFQFYTFAEWIRSKANLLQPYQKIMWKYLGMSFVGINVWILTDGVDGVPFIAFTYFLIAAALILLYRSSVAETERQSHD